MRVGRCALALVLAGLSSGAFAHRLSPAYFGFTEVEPNVYEVQWKVSISGGLVDVLEPQVPEGCAVAGDVRTYVVDDARIQHAAVVCEGGLAGKRFEVDGLAITDTDVLLHVEHLGAPALDYRLVPERPSILIPAEAGTGEVARTYFALGVEHILVGVDHLLFVLALLLLVDGLGRLVATVTAFTVAHSITLAVATLGIVSVPSAPVEATIALSILLLATELARNGPAASNASGSETLTTRFPWLVAFSFGLLHGFGFAGALTEIGLPERSIPAALLFFNLGVEAGQLLFIAAVLALLWVVRRLPLAGPLRLPRLAAYVIGCVAAFWVFERTATAISGIQGLEWTL